MIGGGGERRTLKLVAQYAQWWCADIGNVEAFIHKSAVLDGHCRDVGRDPASVVRAQVTWIGFLDGGERPRDWPDVPIVSGSAESIARELVAFRRAGADHFQIRFMDFPSPDGMKRFTDEVLPVLEREWA
jgi:alkanesulfonate monooxygenase SsuD/methylene tetrahydromethanopterin reductase-like flavin-dependent oxidoreductase (luciferase family)